jgi:5S rRNA maturation endonuclease (ribonuclease M5)
MFVDSTLLADVKKVLGKCEGPELYRRLSDAVRLANTQSKSNDWQIGLMDLCVCDGCVTLPADVGTILAVNQGGQPALIRDQWFQFHVNGPGSCSWTSWNYTDEMGPVVTYKDPSVPVKLVAVVESALDTGIELRVFGWDDDGKRIYTTGAGGILEDGFLVPTAYGFSTYNTEAPAISRIDRISKELTNGFIKLIAVDPEGDEINTQIGYYMPWETVPNYRRIKVPDRSWLRIKYKRRDIEVRGEGDWINLDNREALLLLIKAIKFRLDNQIEQARIYELEGMRLLSNEAESLAPNAISPPQVIFSEWRPDDDRLFY